MTTRSEIQNPTVETLTDAIEKVQARSRTGKLGRKSAQAALDLMARYPGISRLDVRGGTRVAHAYKYPHEATGFVLTRNGETITATVERGTGNDLAGWAIVSCDAQTRETLKTEIGLDRYNQIDRPE